MESWIFNASPLILLGKIGRLDIVEQLNPAYAIPSAVVDELGAGPDDDPAKLWLAQPSSGRKILGAIATPSHLMAWDLGAGETAVLSHCITESGCRAILDDRAARNCAEVYDIPVAGTVGLLIRAKRAGLITLLKPELIRLVQSGSLLSGNVIDEALRLAGE